MHSRHFEHCICVKSIFNLLQLSDDLIFSFNFYLSLGCSCENYSSFALFKQNVETFLVVGCYSLWHANLIATVCTFIFQFGSVESLLCLPKKKKKTKKNNNTLWNRHNDVDNFECGVTSSSTYALISIGFVFICWPTL